MSQEHGAVVQYVEAMRDRIGWLEEQMPAQALEVTDPLDAQVIIAICRELEVWCNQMYNAVLKSPGGQELAAQEARAQFTVIKPSEDSE